MPHIGTTGNFDYDDELLTELVLVYQAARRATETDEGALGILRSYTEIQIARYHNAQDEAWLDDAAGHGPDERQ